MSDPFEVVGVLEERATGCGKVLVVIGMGLIVGLAVFYAVVTGAFQTAFGPAGAPAGNGVADPGAVDGPHNADIPEISPRLFTSGAATASVSGAFQFSNQIEIDPHESQTTPNGESWISFIDWGNPDAGEILVVLGEPENSVTVARGLTHAMGVGDACTFDIAVTATGVSGTVSCSDIEVLEDDKPVGKAAIHLEFSTTSVPWDGADQGVDPYDNAPTDEPVIP